MSRRRTGRGRINFWLDCAALAALLLVTFSGSVLRWVLPPHGAFAAGLAGCRRGWHWAAAAQLLLIALGIGTIGALRLRG
jgi:hypothetical protein